MKNMKKLLAILATFSLASAASASLISFAPNQQASKTNPSGPSSNASAEDQKSQPEAYAGVGTKPIEIAKNKFKGTQEQWESWSEEMINKHILFWTPDAIQGEDYWIEQSENVYRIRSAELIAPELVDFTYVVVADIGQVKGLSYMIDDAGASQINLRNEVYRIISNYANVTEFDYEIDIDFFNGNGRSANVGDFTVSAKTSSLKIIGEFNIHFRKTLDLSNRAIYLNEGTAIEGEAVLAKIQAEIRRWYKSDVSDAAINATYRINRNTDENGSWSIQIVDANADVIFNNFTFTVQNTSLSKVSIDGLSETFDIDKNATQWYIPTRVLELIRRLSPLANTSDFRIDQIRFVNGLASQAGQFWVRAVDTKPDNPITGQFAINLVKTFDWSNHPNGGTEDDWNRIRDEIIDEIKNWFPGAEEGKDYIIDEDNHTITTPDGGWISFPDFGFTVKDDITKLGITGELQFDMDVYSKSQIEMAIETAIGNLIAGPIKPKNFFDYRIEAIDYDNTNGNRPRFVGTYKVTSVAESDLIAGSFDIVIYKNVNFNDIKNVGDKDQAARSKEAVISRIREYKPRARQGVDYAIDENPNAGSGQTAWTFRTLVPRGEIRFAPFAFTIKNPIITDLPNFDGQLDFDIDSVSTTKITIEAKVHQLISALGESVSLGVDYTIEAIPYGLDGRVQMVGEYLVKATPDSFSVRGEVVIRIYKNIDLEQHPTRGTIEQGDIVIKDIVGEISKVLPNPILGRHYTITRTTNGKSWDFELNVSYIRFVRSGSSVSSKFTYTNFVDISVLDARKPRINFKIDERTTTRAVIYAGIQSAISELITTVGGSGWGSAAVGIDYIIPSWSFDGNGNTADKGFYWIEATSSSNLLIGRFRILLWIMAVADPGTW